MKKLNIGQLLISSEWGGAEEVVYQLVKNLKKEEMEVSLFMNNEPRDHFAGIRDLSIYPLGAINIKNKYFFLYSCLKMRRHLIKILKSQPPDLLHIHLEGALFAYFGLDDMFNKIPVIFTLHGPEIKSFLDRESLLVHWLLKRMFGKAKVVTSPSRWQIEDLERKHKLKIVIIPNGVDTEKFRPIKVKREKKTIFFAGRLISMKGIKELVSVAKQLPEYEFLFAGQGPLAKLINLPNTKSLGLKTRNELTKLYNEATICCFPSYHENMPIVGLEALACGKPIIATKLGFSEFIEDGKDGLIIEPKNEKELKEAIVRLMKDSRLRKVLGKNARRKALEYDWRKIIKRYLVLYKNAARDS